MISGAKCLSNFMCFMSGCFWVLLGAYGCLWVLMGAFGCFWVLLGAFGCFWVLLGAFGCLLELNGLWGKRNEESTLFFQKFHKVRFRHWFPPTNSSPTQKVIFLPPYVRAVKKNTASPPHVIFSTSLYHTSKFTSQKKFKENKQTKQ